MKKLILFSALSVFSFNSFADFSLSCTEIYARTMHAKDAKKRRAERVANDFKAASFITTLGAPIVGVSLLAPAIGLDIYASIDSKEEKVLDLANEETRRLNRFAKSLRKKISTDITSEEIVDLVAHGLTSGEFCQDFPHLYSPKDVKRYVQAKLKEKYAVRQ